MSILVNNQAVNIATGSQDLGPVTLPNGLTSLKITIKRCTTATPTIWPNAATTIKASLFVSVDGGVNWIASGSLTSAGGIYVRNGVEVPNTILEVVPIPTGTSRQIKATITVANGPLVSNVTIEAN
jgi:hypothetical protein